MMSWFTELDIYYLVTLGSVALFFVLPVVIETVLKSEIDFAKVRPEIIECKHCFYLFMASNGFISSLRLFTRYMTGEASTLLLTTALNTFRFIVMLGFLWTLVRVASSGAKQAWQSYQLRIRT